MVNNMDYDDKGYLIINTQDDDDAEHNTAEISVDRTLTSSRHDTDHYFIIHDVDRNICDTMEVDPAECHKDKANARTTDSEEIIDLTIAKPVTLAADAAIRATHV